MSKSVVSHFMTAHNTTVAFVPTFEGNRLGNERKIYILFPFNSTLSQCIKGYILSPNAQLEKEESHSWKAGWQIIYDKAMEIIYEGWDGR